MSICNLDENDYCERHKTVHIGYLKVLSQKYDEEGEAYRELWDRQMQPDYKPTTTLRDIANFTGALLTHITQGMPNVTDGQYNERLSICDNCEHCDKTDEQWRCKLCGCHLKEGKLLPGKARWLSMQCPASKWPKLPDASGDCKCH